MQFHVPQFIEEEDKIFGPLTLKQFIYIVGSVGAGIVFWSIFPPVIAIFFAIPVNGLAIVLAFYPVNNRPFSYILEFAVKYFMADKLYLWRKEKKKTSTLEEIEVTGRITPPRVSIPKITEGKLEDLSWTIDVKEHAGGIAL